MMYKYFEKFKKSQVSIYFIGIMATMVVLAFLVINVGKIGKDKTYADNAADAGALAAATVMATCFNYATDANGWDGNNDNASANANANRNQGSPEPGEIPGQGGTVASTTETTLTMSTERGGQGRFTSFKDDFPDIGTSQDTQRLARDGLARDLQRDQQDAARQAEDGTRAREAEHRTVQSDQQGDCDYYTEALVMGYKYNFYNAGIFHRLGRINQKGFQQFLEGINCGTVQNGMPLTYFWVDGAGRIHTVTAIIEIEPANNWNDAYDKASNAEKAQNFADRAQNIAKSIGQDGTAMGQTAAAPPFRGWLEPVADAINSASTSGPNVGAQVATQGNMTGTLKTQSDKGNNQVVNTASDAGRPDLTYNYTKDINNSQTVYSSNFQFHMGGIVKGMRGDVDVLGPNFYPPVQSGAIASFNCNQTGEINPEQHQNSVSFEACLIMTW